MNFKDVLGTTLLRADGGMGTQLQAAGLAPGEEPVLWNLTHPEVIRSVHADNLEAGAHYVTTNTFGANVYNLASHGVPVEQVVQSGLELARAAVQAHGSGFVAHDLGPLGRLIAPLGPLSFEEAYKAFAQQVRAGASAAKAGAAADFILIETMTDTYELKAAVLAAQEQGGGLPVCATVAVDAGGRLLNGANVEVVGTLLEGLGVDALGLNCGAGPSEIGKYAKELSNYVSTPLILNPNAGMPTLVDGAVVYPTSPAQFAEQMLVYVQDCVAVAGGCCGCMPAHIAALTAACEGIEPVRQRLEPVAAPIHRDPAAVPAQHEPVAHTSAQHNAPALPKRPQHRRISSYASVLNLDEGEPLIDYRIDAAVDERLAAALARKDWEYAADDALDARDDGAQVIALAAAGADPNESVNEAEALAALVTAIQAMVNMPLALVPASLEALAAALRVANGCPLVILSKLPTQQHEQARSLAARYGAVIW